MSQSPCKRTALQSLAAVAASAALLLPAAALPAGQPTAVSNLPVVVTGRHKEHAKHPSKAPQPATKDAADGASGEKK